MTHQIIDIDNWNRKAQYALFKTFEQPFFNICAPVDCAPLYHFSKKNSLPFFYCMLHTVLKTIQSIDELRYRIEGDSVLDYKTIHCGVTILQEDNTFIYCTLAYHTELKEFIHIALQDIENQKKSKGFIPHGRKDVVYVSAIPWVSFTAFQHARTNDNTDSIPRIVIGKFYQENEALKIPVSLEIHHALADGYHTGLFFEQLQQNLSHYKNKTNED